VLEMSNQSEYKFWVKFGWLLVLLLISLIIGLTILGSTAKASELDDIIDIAVSNNPQIQTAFKEWEASKEKTIQSKAWADPTLGYGHFEQSIETKTGPQKNTMTLAQKIPGFNKTNLKVKSFQAAAQIKLIQYEKIKKELIVELKKTYYRTYFNERSLEINKQQIALLEGMNKVALRKYETKQTGQQDPLKAQLKIAQLKAQNYKLQQIRKSLISQLKKIVNDPDYKIAKIEELTLTNIESLEFLKEQGSLYRDNLRIARAAQAKDEYLLKLAKLDYWPDYTIGVSQINIEGGDDALLYTFGINLPLWQQKRAAQVKENQAKLGAAKYNIADQKDIMNYKLEDSFSKIKMYDELIALYKNSILPLTKTSYLASQKSYETGQTDFLNWLEAADKLLNTQISFHKLLSDHESEVADLELIIGKSLTTKEEVK
jgi:outer membrane protein, heavy metal efflux system